MAARILDGKAASAEIYKELIKVVSELKEQGIQSGVAVVQIGNDIPSSLYIKMKERACREVGVYSRILHFPDNISPGELIHEIGQLNIDQTIDGILIQLPLPEPLNTQFIMEEIHPQKDVDFFHPYNMGRMLIGESGLRPCTPLGCLALLDRNGISIAGKKAVILGRSNIVGKPLAIMLMQRNATVTICHSRTQNLKEEILGADLLVAAIGQAHFVHGQGLKPGCIVIDVGQHRLADGSTVGDVEYGEASQVAGWITPVPGGTGPMTVAMLMYNTLWAATSRRGISLPGFFNRV